MNEVKKKTNRWRKFFHIEWRAFFILLSMLLANSLSLDFRGNRKKSIINILLRVVGFALATAISFIVFKVCIRLSLFSLLPYVPMSVPSIILSVLLLISFVNCLFRVNKDLYFSNDNKVLLTLPTNGNTLFLTRLAVSFLNTYLKSLTLEIPFLLGYFIVSKYPVFMYFIIFFVFLSIDLCFVLLSALLSIPLYYIRRSLFVHTHVKSFLTVAFTALIVSLSAYLISIIPEKIDIFTNWSPYFNRIQEGLKFYTNRLSFFFETSKYCLGNYTGYTFNYFYGPASSGLYTCIGVLISLPVFFLLSLSLSSPFYLKLASGNDEIQVKVHNGHRQEKSRSLFLSQVRKEFLLFFKDSELISYMSLCFYLPLLLALISKVFMAMDLNSRGLSYVQVAMLLITLLLILSSNSRMAKIYSKEGGAFRLARTYPIGRNLLITSKIILPLLLTSLSLLVSYLIIAFMRKDLFVENLLLGGGILFIAIGHLLYSASLDFTNPQASFGDVSFLSGNENRSIIYAFLLSALFTLLFYYFSFDSIVWIVSVQRTASFKLFLLGLLFLGLNIYLYVERIRYVYAKGDSL